MIDDLWRSESAELEMVEICNNSVELEMVEVCGNSVELEVVQVDIGL